MTTDNGVYGQLPTSGIQIPQWSQLYGKPHVTVSSIGYSVAPDISISTPNAGCDFGPDTREGAGPGQLGPPYSLTSGINEALSFTNGSQFQGQNMAVLLGPGTFNVTEQLQIHNLNVLMGYGPYTSQIFCQKNTSTGYGTSGSPVPAVLYPDATPVKAGHIVANLAFGFQNSGVWTYGVQMGTPGLTGGDVASAAFHWINVRNTGGASGTFVGNTSLTDNNFPAYWCFDGIEDGKLDHCAGGAVGGSPTGLPSSTNPASLTWITNGGSAKIISGNYGWIVCPSVQFRVENAVWNNLLMGHIGKSHITILGGSNGSVGGVNQVYVVGTNSAGSSISGTQVLETVGVNWGAASGYPYIGGPGVGHLLLNSNGDEFSGVEPLFDTASGTIVCSANMHGSYMLSSSNGSAGSLSGTVAYPTAFLGADMYVQGDMVDYNGKWYNITTSSSSGPTLTQFGTLSQ